MRYIECLYSLRGHTYRTVEAKRLEELTSNPPEGLIGIYQWVKFNEGKRGAEGRALEEIWRR